LRLVRLLYPEDAWVFGRGMAGSLLTWQDMPWAWSGWLP
jgi:hypothetical protein